MQRVIDHIVNSALGGVSKTQIKAHLINDHDFTEERVNELIKELNFKTKPKFINYWKLYNLDIDPKAEQIFYPFTKIYQYKNFLTAEECNELINSADAIVRRSSVCNPEDTNLVSDYRTSWTADFDWATNPLADYVDSKIGDLLKLDTFTGEMLQVQRYEPGQYYKEHHDYFDPFTPEYKVYAEWMGQRTWTVMIYLNDVEEGGETYFKHLNLKIKPEQGKAIFWSNLYPMGIPNIKTMHEALPPISGNKYVVTKWWRTWSLI